MGEVLSHDGLHDVCFFDSGRFFIQAVVRKSESIVIDSQLVKNRGIEIANVDRVFDNVVTELIRFAVDDAISNPATGKCRFFGESSAFNYAQSFIEGWLNCCPSRLFFG